MKIIPHTTGPPYKGVLWPVAAKGLIPVHLRRIFFLGAAFDRSVQGGIAVEIGATTKLLWFTYTQITVHISYNQFE